MGGAEIFFIDAMTALKHAKIEQRAIIRPNNDERIKQIHNLNIPVKTAGFKNAFPWPTSSIIRKTVNDFKPDIVQYWMARAASFCVPGNHINIGWHSSNSKIKRFQKCDYQIGVTQDVSQHVIDQNIATDRVFTLPLYTQRTNTPAVSRESLDTPKNVPLLLSLSRLHPVKGLDTLLNAMTQIPDAHLWIAGSGPSEQELKDQTASLGLSNRVRFLGWREDKEALMQTADIYVFPSRNDSFGAVMIEAWAHKTPFIASKAPGPNAYIRHEKDGLLVEIDDPKGLADAIHKVITNTNLKSYLIKNGYERFEKEFTQDAFTENALNIYKNVMANR